MKSIDNPNGVIGSLKDDLNGILGIRDSLGVALMPVYLIVRSWTGLEVGEGTATESKVRILPSPRIVNSFNEIGVQPGGAVQNGDILLKGISKKNYPSKLNVDGTSTDPGIERFYEVDGALYRVIDVTEKHLTWNVQIRKLSDQTRYASA